MIIATEKAKTNTCNRPDIPATTSPALQFLQAKKQKDVLAIGLIHLQLLLLHYDFSKQKNENKYTCDWPNTLTAAGPALQFLQVEKQKGILPTGLTRL